MRKIKKILLIEPPVTRPKEFSAAKVRVSPFFPLGIAYLAAYLEREAFEPKILDCLIEGYEAGERTYKEGLLRYGLLDDEIARCIRDSNPDLIGISAIFSAKDYDAKNIARISKKIFPNVPVVVGGPHAGAAFKEMMTEENAIDYVVIGEGERTLSSLIGSIDSNGDHSKIEGLAYRNNGKILHNPRISYIEDLDSLPLPARHLVDMDKYLTLGLAHDRFRRTPFTQILSSRGCPFNCTFCALKNHWGQRQRCRSAENVLSEIDVLVKQYGIRELHFEDDNLTGDKERALEIFKGLKERNYDLVWTVPTGMAVASLDPEILKAMADSGCYSVTLAVESGSQWVLSKLMRKPVALKKVPELVKTIRDNGMLVKGFFMLGYPGETKETIRETVAFAKSLELDWAFFFVTTPLPYTEMYETALEKGYIEAKDFNPLTSLYESVFKTPEFDNEYLSNVREEAIVDINFRNNPNLHKFDLEQAIGDFKYVLELYPHFDFAHIALAKAYYKKGDIPQAHTEIKQALRINPQDIEANEFLRELEAR